MRTRWWLVLAAVPLALVGALLLASAFGDDGDPATTPAPTTTIAESPALPPGLNDALGELEQATKP